MSAHRHVSMCPAPSPRANNTNVDHHATQRIRSPDRVRFVCAGAGSDFPPLPVAQRAGRGTDELPSAPRNMIGAAGEARVHRPKTSPFFFPSPLGGEGQGGGCCGSLRPTDASRDHPHPGPPPCRGRERRRKGACAAPEWRADARTLIGAAGRLVTCVAATRHVSGEGQPLAWSSPHRRSVPGLRPRTAAQTARLRRFQTEGQAPSCRRAAHPRTDAGATPLRALPAKRCREGKKTRHNHQFYAYGWWSQWGHRCAARRVSALARGGSWR